MEHHYYYIFVKYFTANLAKSEVLTRLVTLGESHIHMEVHNTNSTQNTIAY